MSTPIPANEAPFSIWEVAAIAGGRVTGSVERTTRAVGVTSDSRAVRAGVAFVALVGERFDGHRFVQSAWDAGAAFAIVSQPVGDGPQVLVTDTLEALGALASAHLERWRRAEGRKRTAVVTGSAGKTTTKEILAALLGVRHATWKTPGNLNNRIGLPMVALAARSDHDALVLEAGMSLRGEIAQLAAIARADVAIISSIGLAHAEGVGGALSDVAREKGDIVRALAPHGVAVLHADDPVSMAQAAGARCGHVRTFGRSDEAHVRLVDRRITALDGATLTIVRAGTDATPFVLDVPFAGEAQALDLCAAIAAADAMLDAALQPEELRAGLQNLTPLEGRGRVLRSESGAIVLDDCYNANPESVSRSLELARELASQRALRPRVLLGAMKELGEASAEAHRRVIAKAIDLGFASILGSGAEIDDAIAAHPAHLSLCACGSVEGAIAQLRGALSSEDLLLVKGSRSVGLERVLDALHAVPLTSDTT
jgi:UDP-N-acetylmuramoyl-tripeptide--D-alanyl-D-alanine ligase